MLDLKRFDRMNETEYHQTFQEMVDVVKEWKKDFDSKKFKQATDNLRNQLIDIGMTKAEAQRVIWMGSIESTNQ